MSHMNHGIHPNMTSDEKRKQLRVNRTCALNAWLGSHPSGPLRLSEYPFWTPALQAEEHEKFAELDAEYESAKADLNLGE